MPKHKPLRPAELFMDQQSFVGENYFVHLYDEMPSKKCFNDCCAPLLEDDLRREGFDPKLIWTWEYTFPKKCIYHELSFYDLGNQVLLKIDSSTLDKVVLYFPVSKKEIVEKELVWIFERSQGCKSDKAVVKMLAKTDWGLEFEQFEFDPVSIKKNNYNADFWDFDAHLTNHLTESSGGLVLLHGIPGTGKTSYLLHQCTKLKSKNFIYIPPNMTHAISDPNLIMLMRAETDAVLIIEDAEQILTSRDEGNSAAVSNLLNLTDGFLSKCFDLTVVCTFNCTLNNIDRALLRKGRLKGRYEFGRLTGNALIEKRKELGLKNSSDAPMTLAELYNLQPNHWNDPFWNETENKIGFVA